MQPTPPAPRFAFGPRNYRLMWLGLAVLAAGFVTMTLDSADYGEGFLGLTLGPLLLLAGFIIEFWAILARNGQAETATATPASAPVAAAAAPVPTVTAPAAPAAAPKPVAGPARPTYKRP